MYPEKMNLRVVTKEISGMQSSLLLAANELYDYLMYEYPSESTG